jgi:hypothetical protein
MGSAINVVAWGFFTYSGKHGFLWKGDFDWDLYTERSQLKEN